MRTAVTNRTNRSEYLLRRAVGGGAPSFVDKPPPRATVITGAIGSAIALAELARLGQTTRAVVREALDRAQRVARSRSGFLEENEQPGPLFLGPASGPSGMFVARALAGLSIGDAGLTTTGVNALVRHWRAVRHVPEMTAEAYGGHGSFVLIGNLLLQRLPPERGALRASVSTMVAEARECLLAELRVPIAARRIPLGFAHGVAGQLYTAFISPGEQPSFLRDRLDEYLRLAIIEGAYIAWPAFPGGPIPTTLWGALCNGLPGQLLMLLAAMRRWEDARLSRLAERCASTIFALRAATCSLCCGLAGQAVALLRYGQQRRDGSALRRGRTRLREALELRGANDSFFQGRLGVAVVAASYAQGNLEVPWLIPGDQVVST